MRTGLSIHYKVHPTPKREGDTEQTYHVRQVMKNTIRTQDLAKHIGRYGIISEGLFLMVMERLKKEMVEHLLDGRDLHFDGIGRFSLQLGTKKVKGEDGRLHTKKYLRPDDLTAREVTIEGITFVPDKEMLNSLKNVSRIFVRHKGGYRQKVSRQKLLTTLSNYCQEHGSFTRNDFQKMFSVSRYRAQQMLDELVNAPYPKYYRVKQGPSYVYRKTGD